MTHQVSTSRHSPIIRVFVSSTFSDMKHERDALQEHVFPKLEQLCLKNGFQFQAIDLRWGVSTEAGLDHRTMQICFDELRRAQKISPKPNFLILLGNRYGWRPLPEEISVEEFHSLELAAAQIPGSAGKSEVAVLREWYREDTNAVPPVYLLQSRRQDLGDDQDYTHDGVWKQVQAVLWTIINRAMPPEQLQQRFDATTLDGSPPATVRFQASATEQEIWHGVLRVPDARKHVLAYFREIENLAAFSDPKLIKDFVDLDPTGCVEVVLQTEQDRLKEELRQRLGIANVFHNEAPVRLVEAEENQGGRTTDITTNHLAPLCVDVVSRLSGIIQVQIEEYWRKTAHASLDRSARELEIEQREYERFAKERGGEQSFVGRQAELQAILDYVGRDSLWPLVIHGDSGCGKTALLARASQEVAKTRKRIERFIGVTPRSSDLRSLLSSLCQELRQRNSRADALPTEINELRDEFSQHLQAATKEHSLILFLDALDQLADVDNGRLLNWLPFGPLPAHVKLVVSCLSDRATDDPAGQPFAELKPPRRKIPAGNFINLDVLLEAEARLLLFNRWLPKAGRKVSDGQRARVEQRLASPACCKPIYLKLLFEEAQLWRSYDPATVPGESVPALLGQLFDRLCQPTNHGPLLVNRVLGYLSASQHGLTENEILEILFADPEYRAKLDEATEQTRHELPPTAKRIPIALWSRLRFDLAPYLTEQAAPGANVMTFYHRQVGEWVQEHFGKSEGHTWHPQLRLAVYFRCMADPEGDSSWKGQESRPLSELPWHLFQAGNEKALTELLLSTRFLQAKVNQCGVRSLLLDYQWVANNATLDLMHSTIRMSAHVLEWHPDQLVPHIFGRLVNISNANVAEILRRASCQEEGPWLRPVRGCLDSALTPLIQTYPLNSQICTAVLSDDERHLIIGGDHEVIELWDLHQSVCIRRLFFGEPERNTHAHVAMTPDALTAVSISHIGGRQVWDLQSGMRRALLEPSDASHRPKAVAVSPDGKYAVIANGSNGEVYSLHSFELIRQSRIPMDNVFQVFTSASGATLVVSAYRYWIQLWDLDTGREVKRMKADAPDGFAPNVITVSPTGRFLLCSGMLKHGLRVIEIDSWKPVFDLSLPDVPSAACFSKDENTIAAGCRCSGTVRVWDTKCGRLLHEFQQLPGDVKAAAFIEDGKQLLSVLESGKAQRWNLDSVAPSGSTSEKFEGLNMHALSRDGNIALVRHNANELALWNLTEETCLARLRDVDTHEAIELQLEGNPEINWVNSFVIDDARGRVLVDCVINGLLINADVAINGDVTYKRGGQTRELIGWDLKTGLIINRYDKHPLPKLSLRLPSNYDYLSPTSKVRGFSNCYTGHTRRSTEGNLSFSPDCSVALAHVDYKGLEVWDLENGACRYQLDGHEYTVFASDISSSGRYAASACSKRIIFWDLTCGRQLASFNGHQGWVRDIVFSPDESFVVSTGRGEMDTLGVWEFPSGRLIRELKGPGASGRLVLSNDGKLLATSHGNMLCIWRLDERRIAAQYVGDDGFGNCRFVKGGNVIRAVRRQNRLCEFQLENFSAFDV